MRLLVVTILCSWCGAVEFDGLIFAVDRPNEWWDPRASHHGKHAVLGAEVGFLTYGGARLFTDERPTAWWIGTGSAATVGVAYEVIQARKHGCWVDPADALWTAAGGAIGATCAYATDRYVITPLLGPETVAVGFACRF